MIDSPLPPYDASEFLTSWNDEDLKGSGSFACVRKCEHKQLGKFVAKCFSITGSRERYKEALKEIERETNILFRLDHKNIVQIHGVTQWANNIGIVMECMDGGNLEDFLMSKVVPDIPWLLRLRFFHDIADGLSYMHFYDITKAFVHSDLKPQNILLTPDLMIKIADFGSVNVAMASNGAIPSLQVSRSSQFTAFYSAPEVLKNLLIKKKPSMDIYSLAMNGFEILTRRPIFEGVNYNRAFQAIMDLAQKPDVKLLRKVEKSLEGKAQDLQIFEFLEELMIKCWDNKPEKRPDSRAVRNETNKKLRSLAASRHSYHINDLRLKNKLVDKPPTTTITSRVELSKFRFPFEEASLSSQSHVTITESMPTTTKMQDLTLTSESSRHQDEQSQMNTKPQVVIKKPSEESDNHKKLSPAKTNMLAKDIPTEKVTIPPVPANLSLKKIPQSSKDKHHKKSTERAGLVLSENKQAKKASEILLQQIQKFSNKDLDRDDKLQLLSLWVQLYELKDSSLMKRAAEYFPSKLNLSLNPLNEIQVRAFSEILKFTNKFIEKIGLSCCQLRSTSFRQISTALLESSSTVGKLDINYNQLDGVEDVIELIPRVSHKMWLYNSFTDGRGGERRANKEEQNKIQRALDECNSSLKVQVDVDFFTFLQSKK